MALQLATYRTLLSLRASSGPHTRPWMPSDSAAALALWLDANDASTITQSGGLVTSVADKSGNGNTASQANTAHQPSYVTGTHPYLSHSGNQWLIGTITPTPSAQDHTIFAVASANLNTTCAYFCYGGNGQTNYNSCVGNSGYGSSVEAWWFGGWGQDSDYGGGVNDGNVHIVEKLYTSSSLTINGYFDGSDSPVFTKVNAGLNYQTTVFSYAVGSQTTNGNNLLNGKVQEIVVLPSAVSATQRQKFEGYLAWKWGLVANLPADHPYKSAAPTVPI